MVAKAKKDLMQVPGYSRGVREVVGLRMLKMCRPICPNSRVEMEQDMAGNWRAIQKGPDAQNCQQEGGQWWKICGERGHEPYWRVSKWYTKRDITAPVLDDEGNPTGEIFVERTVMVPHETRQPNLAQVAIANNINSGRGPQDAIERKGFKYLGTLGFDECCQYRNCQKEVNPKHVIDGIGRYCSRKHLELVSMTHAQQLGAAAIRLVSPSIHKANTTKERNLRRKEVAEAMQIVDGVTDLDGM